MGKSKRVGNSFENAVIKLIVEAYGCGANDVRRSKLSGAHKDSCGDVAFSTDMEKRFPFSVECKHRNSITDKHLFTPYNLQESSSWLKVFWEQCVGDARKGNRLPLLVYRGNRAQIMCVVFFQDAKKSLSEWNYGQLLAAPKVVNRCTNDRMDVKWIVSFKLLLNLLAATAHSRHYNLADFYTGKEKDAKLQRAKAATNDCSNDQLARNKGKISTGVPLRKRKNN